MRRARRAWETVADGVELAAYWAAVAAILYGILFVDWTGGGPLVACARALGAGT